MLNLGFEQLGSSSNRANNEQKIMRIIKAVQRFDKHGDIKKLFMEGFCYDFAIMIWRSVPGSKMFYDTKKRHYYVEYNGKFYDIIGEVDNVKTEYLEEDDYQIVDGAFDERCRTHK